MITLKTLPQATAQEVFDQVARHLLTQGERCVDKFYHCQYSSAGKKCAAGCLIADCEYRSDFEETAWEDLAQQGLVPEDHFDLICDLQGIHDVRTSPPSDWKPELAQLARDKKLSPAVLEEFA